jgi:two-component system OmpR family sensor kinase
LRSVVESIERQAQRLNQRIESLLDVSRLQRGQFTLDLRPLDLAALTGEAVNDFRLSVPPTVGSTIILEEPGTEVAVVGDPGRLEEALQNLLSNAVKYSPTGGTIGVRVAQENGEAILEVADQGIGIPPEGVARLIEPIYPSTNVGTQASGFGLGLYIVHEIVERHGGRLMVHSTEGQGTTFRVLLPLAEG